MQNIRNELSIYSQFVDFDKLFLELDLYYKMKTDNFDNSDELILKFELGSFFSSHYSLPRDKRTFYLARKVEENKFVLL